MSISRRLSSRIALAATLFAGVLAAGAAQARTDVYVSIGLPVPAVVVPAPVLLPPRVVVAPPPSYPAYPAYPVYRDERGWHEHRGYREPSRWDVDGDGIPNRYDRVYNPRWDRNGNGVPDRREYRDDRRWDDRREWRDDRGWDRHGR